MQNIFDYLIKHGLKDVAEHSIKVAELAKEIALRYNLDGEKAYLAGSLHDIGNVIPNESRASYCEERGVTICEEERRLPHLLHPKISVILSREIFKITDSNILSAIEFHTTLRKDPTSMDMTVFIADKLSWDAVYNNRFYDRVKDELEKSLNHACFAYLDDLFTYRKELKVVHPLAEEAYDYLRNNFNLIL